jgi:hypothetical protein
MTTPYTPGPGDRPQQPPQPALVYPPPAPPRKSRAGMIVALVIVGLLALCGIGVIAFTGSTKVAEQLADQDAANQRAAGAGTSSTPTSAAAKPSNGKSTPAEVRVPAGAYTVGEDIPPGRYKVAERAPADCYWQVSGAGGDLVDNAFGGGFPAFTVKKGQQVETNGCPDFVLQAK